VILCRVSTLLLWLFAGASLRSVGAHPAISKRSRYAFNTAGRLVVQSRKQTLTMVRALQIAFKMSSANPWTLLDTCMWVSKSHNYLYALSRRDWLRGQYL
jgi:hypothetical protein